MENNKKERSSKQNNTGLATSFGAGIGIILGRLVFNRVGLGLVISAGLGVT